MVSHRMNVFAHRARRFLHKVGSSQMKGLHGDFGTPAGNGTQNDHRHFYLQFPTFLEELDAIHLGHFEVKNNDVRSQCFKFLEGKNAVHGLSRNRKAGGRFHDAAYEVTHERRIVHDQDVDSLFCHAPSFILEYKTAHSVLRNLNSVFIPNSDSEWPM